MAGDVYRRKKGNEKLMTTSFPWEQFGFGFGVGRVLVARQSEDLGPGVGLGG
jgi:hypothetical protein